MKPISPRRKNINITPAAIIALAQGDLGNFISASTPGGIEAQEARGQMEFCKTESLPIKMRNCKKEDLEKMGIKIGEAIDDLFVRVELPTGWRKIADNHSMHSWLVDDQGRKRASLFYKAAFYDRVANMSLTTRFDYIVVPYKAGKNNHVVVNDGNKEIWKSDPLMVSESDPWVEFDELRKNAIEWLSANYPDWKNPVAYWD